MTYRIDESEVKKAIQAVVEAGVVLLVGVDQMAFFASYLRHLFMLLGIEAVVVAAPYETGLQRLGAINARTLVIGFSAGRSHPLVTRGLKLANVRGADSVAVTDTSVSDVASLARIRLVYPTTSPSYVRSFTSLMALIQAWAFGVYSCAPQQFDEQLGQFDYLALK